MIDEIDRKLIDAMEITTTYRLKINDLMQEMLNKLSDIKVCKIHQELILQSLTTCLISDVVDILVKREKLKDMDHGQQ